MENMPFGLPNAPSTFQNHISKKLVLEMQIDCNIQISFKALCQENHTDT